MKLFEVETSLYEPVQVKIGEKVYQTQPLSRLLIQGINDVNSQFRGRKIDGLMRSLKMAALLFGVEEAEFDKMDIRALTPAVEFALGELNSDRPNKGEAVNAKPESEMTREELKN